MSSEPQKHRAGGRAAAGPLLSSFSGLFRVERGVRSEMQSDHRRIVPPRDEDDGGIAMVMLTPRLRKAA